MDIAHSSDPPSLMQALGAMLYGARAPLSAAELRRVLLRVAAQAETDGPEKIFAKVKESEVRKALDDLHEHLEQAGIGVRLGEVADGFRYQTDLRCAPWVRDLLNLGKPARLSRPALETLAIIAYRQPITRAEIEAVRGVAVDAMIRTLLEGGLLRIVARSDLPGRPMLYGTTQQFLEHFGIKNISELPGIEQLARRDEERSNTRSSTSEDMNESDDQTQENQQQPETNLTLPSENNALPEPDDLAKRDPDAHEDSDEADDDLEEEDDACDDCDEDADELEDDDELDEEQEAEDDDE